MLIALLLAIGSGVFSSQVMSQTEVLSALVVDGNPVYAGFLTFWGYIILLSPAMPMALYISLVASAVSYPVIYMHPAHLCLCVYNVFLLV